MTTHPGKETAVTTTDATTDAAEIKGAVLTASAASKVRELIEAEGDPSLALRLGVRPGGCSGFSYEMYFDSQIDPTDIVNETEGVKIVIDEQSAALVSGAMVDFRDQGLQGAGFAIDNPSQTRSCGCGQSFC